MDFIHILHIVGAVAMLAYGLTSFFAPKVVADAVSQTLEGKRGVAEFRIGNGGFFTAMAVFALFVNNPITYKVLGIAWLGGAIARLIAYVIDKPKFDWGYVGLFCLELTMAVFLLVY
jgi:uncharacterized membrane protein